MNILIFCILSLPLIVLSLRSLSLKHHGMYRLLLWECILWLAVENHRHMIVEEFDLQQVTSSILMVASLAFVLSAVVTMRRKGRTGYERKDPTLFAFERTTVLVDSGIFQFVRHPMYSSLLLLAWGIMMRRIEIDLFLVACAATISGVMAACIEERENLSYFGEPYKRYAATSRIK